MVLVQTVVILISNVFNLPLPHVSNPFPFIHPYFLFSCYLPPISVCFLLASWRENHICPLPPACWYGKSSQRPATNVNLISVFFFSTPSSLPAPRFRLCFLPIHKFPFHLSPLHPLVVSRSSEPSWKLGMWTHQIRLTWWDIYQRKDEGHEAEAQQRFKEPHSSVGFADQPHIYMCQTFRSDPSDIMNMHHILLRVHMLFTTNTSCWLRKRLHSVSVVVIKVENVFVCFPFFPVGIMTWKSVSTHRQRIRRCWQSKVIKSELWLSIHTNTVSCTYSE